LLAHNSIGLLLCLKRFGNLITPKAISLLPKVLPVLQRRQVLMHKLHRDGSLTDGGGASLD
jgi:hypothetical protein